MKKVTDSTKKVFSKTKIRKQFTSKPYDFPGEVNNSPSMTIPDMTLGVKQLLLNHTRGIHSDVGYNEPMYFDQEIPIINDLTDLDDYRQDLKNREKALNDKIKDDHNKNTT